jgi:hypothetical protein
VSQQEMREAMARAEEIGAYVFATAQQVTGGFFLIAGNVNRGERARAIQDREVAGIAAIGLNSVAGAAWDEGRGDDVTRDLVGREGAVQFEAAGAGFVAALHRARPAKALDKAHNRRAVRRQRMHRRYPLTGQ